MTVQIPQTGRPHDKILDEMRSLAQAEASWEEGRTWSLVYHAGEEHTEFLKEAHGLFFSENALNPLAFPALRRFEAEVVRMTASMLNGDDRVAGTMTSGGTESLLMAVKTYRDWARATKGITEPNMVLPVTAHAAFDKAAHYFGVRQVRVQIADDLRADPAAMEAAITSNTILMVGSAPDYPFGQVDPIEDLATIALGRGIGFHVDSCLGGFLVPWMERLGVRVGRWDFRVPGVTSMSADVHKYGFAAKGASTILYRTPELRRFQFHVTTDWPGGIYASPSMAGTRPGGPIAAAWAALQAIGQDGYLTMTEQILDTSRRLIDGVRSIDGLTMLGDPKLSVFSFVGTDVDTYAIGDVLESRGWHVDRQIKPASLHFMVTPAHAGIVDAFLEDLQRSVDEVRAHPELATSGQAAMYGMMTTLPDSDMLEEIVLQTLDGLYST
ncbi:MAG TPA: aspartate aminotransferase family protein [Actinobacteria bacterium]|nr:aspartate aminotransferase family protein [Actinomycetota bacterium]HDL50061.1 aspartate aminotransferase family protein [Actinomycetota bacterium]